MSYNLREYREYRLGQRGKQISDFTITEGAFSINAIGNGYEDFSQDISEIFSWIGNNFENNELLRPENPIVGQTWYNSANRTLNVYDTKGEWNTITTSLSDNNSIDEDITPIEDSTYDIGNDSFRFKEGYVYNIFADTINYANTNSGVQNIFIDENTNTSLKKKTNLYPSIVGNNSLMEDIDSIIDLSQSNTAAPWTTTTNIVDDAPNNNVTVDLTERDHLVFINNANNVTFVNVSILSSIDSQLTIFNNGINSLSVIFRREVNVNYVYGNLTTFTVPPQSSTKITTFKTNTPEVIDLIAGSTYV